MTGGAKELAVVIVGEKDNEISGLGHGSYS